MDQKKNHIKIHTSTGLGAELVATYTDDDIKFMIEQARGSGTQFLRLISDEFPNAPVSMNIEVEKIICYIVRDFEHFKELREKLRREAMLEQARGLGLNLLDSRHA